MADFKNAGFDPEEINALKEECRAEGYSFIHLEDEDVDAVDSGELARIQFPGQYEGQEMIYDAYVYTLRLHHSSLVYEMATKQVRKTYPQYIAPEDREPNYKIAPELEEEAETALTEIIQEIEETETIKVQEHVEVNAETDYGVELDVCLNVEEITDEVLENFVRQYNGGTLKLDTTLYSFTSEDEE